MRTFSMPAQQDKNGRWYIDHPFAKKRVYTDEIAKGQYVTFKTLPAGR